MMGQPNRSGNRRRLREESREVWGWRWLDDLAQDLRYAVRTLVAHKTFTATAVATLGLGVGATTAIFSVVSGLVLRPLPFPESERLVQVYGSTPLVPERDTVASLDLLRRESTSFETLVGYDVSARYLRAGDGAERVMVVRAEGDFFTMLGVQALRGRTFTAGDPPAGVVIGEAFWRRQLGGDPAAIGRTLVLDDQAFTVMGVMPASFQFPYGAASLLPGIAAELRTDLWMPFEPAVTSRPGARMSHVTGRLKPGIPPGAAESELKAIAARLETVYPETHAGRSVYVEPLAEAVVSRPIRRILFLLFGAVGLLLALACANVANLSLARMALRVREVAVRSALGAGRFRLVRQFLTESLLLSLVGGAAGLIIAWWGSGLLLRAAAAHVPRAHEVTLDWRVFLFLLAACAGIGALLGLVPALAAARAGRSGAPPALQEASGRSTMSAGQRRLRNGLVVAEVAVAFVLSVGAAMFVRELIRLRSTDAGIATANVITFHVGHRMTPQTDTRQFYAIEDRVAELPGVRAAGFIQLLPLQNWGWSANSDSFAVRGRPPVSPVFPVQLRYITPGYLEALGIRLVAGRGFTAGDDRGAPPVVLINETLARRYFGNEDPVGHPTSRGTIVGLVGDVRQATLDRPSAPELYFPVAQNWSQLNEVGMTLVVRSASRPESLAEPVRAVAREVNPALAIFDVKTMEQVVAESLSDFTIYLSLMAGFAVLALVLALTGTYGVIAYIASARTKEFAIRMALGADRTRVTRLVLGQGVSLTGLGLALGVVGALAAAPLVRGLPVTVRPPDVVTTAPVALFIAIVALVASLVPALRAARVNPMSALRQE